MLRTMALLFCCVLFAGYSFADSVAPPQALEFVNVEFNRYPIPGTAETITFTIRANTNCTAEIKALCRGDIALVAPQDTTTTTSLFAGAIFTKSIAVTYSPGESARLTLEVRALDCQDEELETLVSRDITIVPGYGSDGITRARVGVYFDQDANVTCLPDSTNYPFLTTAYIILTDYAETSGPIAWEGRLEADENIILMNGGIAGQTINLAQFPSYRVGLGVALTVSNAIVLATINLLVDGPGGIYFKGLDDNDPTAYPSFVPDGGNIIAMQYANGGLQDIVASIGNMACPEVTTDVDCFASMSPAPAGKTYEDRNPQERFTSQGGGDSQKRTNQTYNVSISGRVAYLAANGSSSLGIYGSRVEFWFVNRANPSSWWHPIIGNTQYVHYDMLDENGAFDFSFSFVGDLTQYGVYDKIFILLNPENSGAQVPAPEDGYRVWGSNGYYDLLNERNGVTITITPADPSIQQYKENTFASRSYGALLRNTKLSHEAISTIYNGQIPFSLPRITGRISDLTPGYAGFYHSCDGSPWIEIDQDAIQSYVVDHEYGHHMHHRAWGLDCSSNWTHSTANEMQEGWAIFYSFVVRSYSQRTYGHEDQWSSSREVPEVAPYLSTRYGNIAYAQVGHPEFAALSCYLWNLFDGYDDTGLEAAPYVVGDNEDISGRHVRVFTALAGMPRSIPAMHVSNYDWTFQLGLDAPTQDAVGKIKNFMYADLYVPPSTAAMHPAQVRDLTIETPLSSEAIIRWSTNRYASGYFINPPSGHRLYKLNGSTWQAIAEVGWNVSQFTYSADNVAGAYRVTAFNNLAGESISAPETTIGVSTVAANVDQGTRFYGASPNPFNPTTTIKFRVGADSDVRVDLMDITGKHVQTLISERMAGGDYEVVWNGRDENGRQAASGLYFCRIAASGDTDVIKVSLVK